MRKHSCNTMAQVEKKCFEGKAPSELLHTIDSPSELVGEEKYELVRVD